ncbi:MAG: putative glycoside hydrolase [Patescibacteria group bacterium]|nr:putative glycoside hydrolase [Patescibacteria group bacterium]
MDTEKSVTPTAGPKNASGFYVAGSLGVLLILGGVSAFILIRQFSPFLTRPSELTVGKSSADGITINVPAEGESKPPVIKHISLPQEVRGIYWTAHTAGTSRADSLLAYASSSHLNTVVIDLKLDDGTLAFAPLDPEFKELYPVDPVIDDLDALLDRLGEQGIYRIARIAVMRDKTFGELHPEIALRDPSGGTWRDNTGMQWLDPAAPEVAEYALALAHEAYRRGFDEIQFDYVRFASDGRLSAIRYPIYDGKQTKAEVMRDFFQRVGGTLQEEKIPVSFDLFGLTYCTTDDLNIGQRLADVYPFADFLSPMAYPSHYANGFEGFANPALYPYEVVKRTLEKGIEMLKVTDPDLDPDEFRKKSRPWIQDFDIGANYDAAKVKAQIKASRDAGASGWLIWNARNVYTPIDYLK